MALTLHHPDGQVFSFDAGTLCLELACGTGGEGFRARFEQLHEPADVDGWSAESRLHRRAVTTKADLRALKRLREAIWAAAYAVVTGAEPDTADIESLNRHAAGPAPVPQIDPHSRETAWRGPLTGRELIAEIARDAVRTLGRPTRDRIRMCEGVNCSLVYLDTSRPGRRRWCSMQRCGNRHKVRAFRSRQEEAAA
jgi:predicted RNA-binding Zn ribbon-like protein